MALVEEFLRTSGNLVRAAEDALRSQNQQQISELAHAVKSPAANVGLMVLGDLCESIRRRQCDAHQPASCRYLLTIFSRADHLP